MASRSKALDCCGPGVEGERDVRGGGGDDLVAGQRGEVGEEACEAVDGQTVVGEAAALFGYAPSASARLWRRCWCAPRRRPRAGRHRRASAPAWRAGAIRRGRRAYTRTRGRGRGC